MSSRRSHPPFDAGRHDGVSELLPLLTLLAAPSSILLVVRHLNRRDEAADLAAAPVTTR